ncbi:MAG: T9SS type A sorting domain-containing protein [Flavobacteriales bacterium]|nr:T9SS type A sorting domain-containing protein [Flavobacteriales bacterium]MBK6755492.1 T9SS type A sorting domain-containing protein [Flavobacteriales bacterium]
MRASLFSLLLLPLLACGQSWCVPGATWRYNVLFIYGYIEYSYAGDTLINGMEAQVLDVATAFQYPQPPPEPPSPPQYTYDPVAYITRNEGDLVFLWDTPSQTWDTLFWWGAQVGEGWTMAHGGPACQAFEVLDTGTMEVDGVELRWLDLNNVSVRIVERIGSLWDFFPVCPPGHIDGMGGLRCYTDNEIHFQQPSWNYGCTSMVSIEEELTNAFKLFPNPGTTHFTLSGVEGYLSPGPHTIALFDATGRMVLQQRTADARTVISTQTLPAGLYRIAVRDEQGGMMGATWVKE